LGVLLLIRETRVLAVRAGDERALVADPELAARVEGPGAIAGPVVRLRRHEVAVAPDDGYWATPGRRRELVSDARRLRCRLGELARLPDRSGERLLRVDVLPSLERHHRRHGVRVVGRRHRNGVYVASFLIEHLAVVAVLLRLGEGVEAVGGITQVDVAERVDV